MVVMEVTTGRAMLLSMDGNMPDDTVGYFKGLANDTAPLRGEAKKAPTQKTDSPTPTIAAAAPKAPSVLKYDDDDLKYMSKQAYKIGERLSRAAGSKRPALKQSPKR